MSYDKDWPLIHCLKVSAIIVGILHGQILSFLCCASNFMVSFMLLCGQSVVTYCPQKPSIA
jgi:hypothetical protein